MKSDLVEIACKVVEERDKAVAIADGTEEEVVDGRTGEIRTRQKWHWLPKSQVEVYAEDGIVKMPEWLAHEKGLI